MTLPRDQQATGISIGYSGGSLGAILTPLIVTPVALAFGWRSAFWMIGAIGMVWVIGWLVASRWYPVLDANPDVGRTPLREVAGAPLWAFLVLYSFGAIPLAAGIYAAPIFLSRVFGLSQASLGHWLWIPPLGWELGYLFWGWTADKSGTALGRVVLTLAVVSAVTAAIPFAPGPASALLLFFLSMFAAAGFVMCSLKYGLQHYPRDQALLAGVGAGAWSGLVALVMPIIGTLFDAGRYSTAFIGVACLPLVGTAIWAAVSRRVK
jgi:ACS family hexuronate transporter-like MFS transporter